MQNEKINFNSEDNFMFCMTFILWFNNFSSDVCDLQLN